MLAGSTEEWAGAQRQSPRYAVLFEDNFNYLTKMCLLRMREAAFTMIAAARERGCTVIVCGSDMTDHAGRTSSAARTVILGEGEITLGELLRVLERLRAGSAARDAALAAVPGSGVHQRAGRYAAHAAAARTSTTSMLVPFPAWDLVDVARYRAIWMARHGYFSMNMVTTRGCPFHCNWCAKPIWGQRYNVRSPENVVAEMKWLKEHLPPGPHLVRGRHLGHQARLARAVRGRVEQARGAAARSRA